MKALASASVEYGEFRARASHAREGHDLKLRDAGAVHLAHSWPDVERFALHFFNG